MIVYFADRHFNILGHATTGLPGGVGIVSDLKTEDIETGVAIFECDVGFDRSTREKVEAWAEVGNYVLRDSGEANELYTILDAEIDTKKQTVSIYAEDEGMDLLNEVCGEYEADQHYEIAHYIDRYVSGSGWEIGINELEGITRKLKFDEEQTASARLLKIAEHFNNCELSFSFTIDGLQVTHKYINIFAERGKNTEIPLRLNKEIDSIITTKSISNLATALQCRGGTPDNEDSPVTLLGYEYDDGDFYVDGSVLKSRTALKNWSRYLWGGDNAQAGGHIVKQYSDESLSQGELLENAIAELKEIRDMEINYDVDITDFPENISVGDRVNVIDDAGGLYVSSRVLVLETSCTDNNRRAVLGEHLIRKSGISSTVEKLAAKFAKQTVSVQQAKKIATDAKKEAEAAQTQAEAAVTNAQAAQTKADEAKAAVATATESANNARAEALAAQSAVDKVEEKVSSMETTVQNAQTAANNAQQAANTADAKADEAKTAAQNAQTAANNAVTSAETAQGMVAGAISKAEEAQNLASTAKSEAEAAAETARSAKVDAELAKQDIDALGDELENVTTTMRLDYARKTDLTESTANLQTQISQSAAEIESTASKVFVIDETTNKAQEQLRGSLVWAEAAQEKADQATADAEIAQDAADEAEQNAIAAQNEAAIAQAAAETARSVLEQANADLAAARADLATITGRADATEEEIETARAIVIAAEHAAEQARSDAESAVNTAQAAQEAANEAVSIATNAQTLAANAIDAASDAQRIADEAKGNAQAAQSKVAEAEAIAISAQATANTAKANADVAQATANAAATASQNALNKATDAEEKARQAADDLAEAQRVLEEVKASASATENEIAEAQRTVNAAQTSADEANQAAIAARESADNAQATADDAQAAADEAKTASDNAQAAAAEAWETYYAAKVEVDGLAVRMTAAETSIKQNTEGIKLSATKTEVSETLGGYYTKSETEAALEILSNKVLTLVRDENGHAILEQTAEGWTFSTTEIQNAVNDASNALTTLTDALGSTDAAVDVLKQTINDWDAKAAYVRIEQYEGEPCIELGKSGSDYKLMITNTRIMFRVGSDVPTYIDNKGLATTNITVENELSQGKFVWKVHGASNYGLMWKGANS